MKTERIKADEAIYERCFLAALTGVLAGWNHGGEIGSAVEIARNTALEACEHLMSERSGITPGMKGK